MLTLRAAAGLLADARDIASLAPLAALAGIRGAPLPLDRASRAALGLGAEAAAASVARGDGSLRALLVELAPGVALHDALRGIGTRLAARAPHLLWLLIATERQGRGVGLAAWSADRRPPRVAGVHVQRDRVVPSDAETVRALAAAPGALDALVHQRWLDVLGRDALTRRFFRALEARVRDLADAGEGRADDAARRSIALLCVSRLLFLAFLETRGWLDGDPGFLVNSFERGGGRRGWHRAVLDPLLFGTLNTPVRNRSPAARAFGRIPFLNGGLFARTSLERRCALRFPDETLGRVFSELLGRYRFTAREDDGAWSEAAVDPEMLGRAFECLMAADERKASGAFYTPQALVEHVTSLALVEALAARGVPDDIADRALRGEPIAEPWRASLASHCADLRVLDPACGSGAFLVHALERLAALRALLGDARPLAALRRETLARSIFGVDVNPTAVWLCELRLWLSVVIESDERDPLRVPPLPNLDRQVRTGDALLGGAFDDGADARAGRRVAALRARYTRATGRRKVALQGRLEAEERERAIETLDRAMARLRGARRELVLLGRARDLFGQRAGTASRDTRRLRELRARAAELRRRRTALADGGALPFLFGAHFADVAARGGFDALLGNPPWVRPHHVPPAARVALRREFRVARDAGWAGRDACGAGRGFASQTDVAALFVERSLSLLRPGGALALLLPAKLWRSLSGGGVRRLLAEEARVRRIEDWSDAPATFDAAVYPSVLVARRLTNGRGPASDDEPEARDVVVAVRDRGGERRWRTDAATLALDGDAASPWLLAAPAARAAFDRVAAAGVPLADTRIGRPLLGVKCGANDAFSVTVLEVDGPIAIVATGAEEGRREGRVERCLLRPLLRGEDVRPWRATSSTTLVWTHGSDGRPLPKLPDHAAAWLAPWRQRLAARSDARGRQRWWSLFRTESAAYDLPRVVWCDMGRAPRAAMLVAGDDTVPLNSCYVARCPSEDDALAFAALLNGPLAAAWLSLLAEPARGGYRRFLGWTMALLPLPRDWERAVRLLAPLARGALNGGTPSPAALLDAALAAYALEHASVAALLEEAPPLET